MRPPTRMAAGMEMETRRPGMPASLGRVRLTISATVATRCRRGGRGGGNGDGNAQAGDAGQFGARAIDDIGHGGYALPPREQVDHQTAGSAGGSEIAATGHGVETLH